MSGLPDTVAMARSGVFHIVCLNQTGERIASGTAFSAYGYLITNAHVASVPANCTVWIRREGDTTGDGFTISQVDFTQRLVSASPENSFDFAILDIQECVGRSDVYSFKLDAPKARRVGETIAFLGYPLEHHNLTCHSGIISSFYRSGVADIIQIDASVNASNSGGPLIDIYTGTVMGIISRKATGLSGLFSNLRTAIKTNIDAANNSMQGGTITFGGFNPISGFVAGQNQILHTLGEIERQANVGIGYAISAEHMMGDNVLHSRMTRGSASA